MAQTIKANGININYQLDSQADGAANAPVVLLNHSLLADLSIWDDQIEKLTRYFQILRYDARGHGASEIPNGPWTAENFADDIVNLLDALEIEKVHFVGLSMGGFIALPFAQRYQNRLLSLSICDAACQTVAPEAWETPIALAESKGVGALITPNLQRWFTDEFRNSGSRKIKKIIDIVARNSASGFVNSARAFQHFDYLDTLADIDVPTLIIVGADDPACPVSASETLHEGIRGSSLIVIENCSHLPNVEQSDAFNSILTHFLVSLMKKPVKEVS